MTKLNGYVQKGAFFYHYIDGVPHTCVSCGQAIAYTSPSPFSANHKCPPRVEAARKAANTRGINGTQHIPEPLYGQRLEDGFEMLRDSDYEFGDG